MKLSKRRRKEVLIKYKLTKEPSLTTNNMSSAGALAHHESKSSIKKQRKEKTLKRAEGALP